MPFDLSTASPVTQQSLSQLTGEDYLKQLPVGTANLVRKYASGELAVTPQMTRTPAGQQLLGAITQYDPSFDATNFQKRQQTATAFSKGLQGNAVRGANQALYHMGNLYQRVEDLNNLGGLGTPLNAPINWVEEKLDPYHIFSNTSPANISKSTKPLTNNKGWTLHTDAQGNQAYVSPDGKQFEEAK